jgi:hypothetical protein
MAAIHRALGDNKTLILRALCWAEKALSFKESINYNAPGYALTLLNPMTYVDMSQEGDFSNELSDMINEKNYDDFKKEII